MNKKSDQKVFCFKIGNTRIETYFIFPQTFKTFDVKILKLITGILLKFSLQTLIVYYFIKQKRGDAGVAKIPST